MFKKFVFFCLVVVLFFGSASALVFYNQQGEPVVPCGQSIFECITMDKIHQLPPPPPNNFNDNSLLMSTVLNKQMEAGKNFKIYYKGVVE